MAVDQAKIIFIFYVKAMVLMKEDLRWWSHINDGPHGGTGTLTLSKNICVFLPTYGSLNAQPWWKELQYLSNVAIRRADVIDG